MTRDEIIAKWESMTPLERNAWVMQDVFDWDLTADPKTWAWFRPAEGMAMAGVVLEKMESNGWNWTIYHDGLKYASFSRPFEVHRAKRSNTPESICLAALLAVLGDAQ